jgi:hypothetical protein
MSDLDSLFDVVRGWPNGSALAFNFAQKTGLGTDLTEGEIVDIEDQAGTAVVDRMTSSLRQGTDGAVVVPDQPWVIVQGMDQTDAEEAKMVAALKLKTGLIFKVPKLLEHNVGDFVSSNNGAIVSIAHATAQIGATGVYYTTDKQPIGQVIEVESYYNWVLVQA